MRGAPSAATSAELERRLERQRRLAGLRLSALGSSVLDAGDAAGFARLTRVGAQVIVAAQEASADAVAEYLVGALADNGVSGDDVRVAAEPGRLAKGQSVEGFLAQTEPAVQARVAGGSAFDEALRASMQVVLAVGASEAHRIGRDAVLSAALGDERWTRYARIAEASACQFCLMLETRGAVYLSATTAGQARRFHPHCRCRIVPVVGSQAIAQSQEAGALNWQAMRQDYYRARGGAQPQPLRQMTRAEDVAQQLRVLRRQVQDGTATAWTRQRIAVLEAEQLQTAAA